MGLQQGVATGPYSLQLAFDTIAEVESLGVDFLSWTSAGVASTDEVSYYSSLDGINWTLLGKVTKDQAKGYPTIATGMDAYHFVLETEAPVQAKFLKAEFSRGFNPDKDTLYGWVAFDEFTATGTLTSQQPLPAFEAIDSATGISVKAPMDTVPQNAQLEVRRLAKTDTEYQPVGTAFANEKLDLAAYLLELQQDGEVLLPNGTLTISIPLPAGFDANDTKLYQINQDGTKTLLETMLQNGALVAQVQSLGTFALAQAQPDSSSGSGSSGGSGNSGGSGSTSNSSTTSALSKSAQSPQTSDSFAVPMMALTSVLVVSLVVLFALILRNRRNLGE